MSPHQAAQPRVAVIGCGYWGKNLVRDFANLGALGGIVEANPATRDALIAQHGTRALTLDEALADPALAGVVIAAPAEAHFEIARRALDAGKHVYVEKPLALTVKDGAELVKLAGERGLQLMVGHLLQYHPAFIALKAFVASGAIGQLTYVYSNRLSYGILRREEDVLWSFAPHDLSMILSIVGEEPTHVGAFSAPTLHPTIGDFCQVQMAFANGVKAHVFCSWLHPFKEQRLVVVGERGAVVFEDSAKNPADKLKHYAHSVEWQNGIPKAVKATDEGGIALPYGDGNPLKDECRHFLEVIASGKAARTDGAEGLRVLRALERASAAVVASAHGPDMADATEQMHQACLSGDTAMVESLLSAGADANQPDSSGRTPVMLACRGGHLDTVKCLVAHGAELQMTNKNGTTALMYAKTSAVGSGNLDLLRFLVEHGALVSSVDNSGKTALDYLTRNYNLVADFLGEERSGR